MLETAGQIDAGLEGKTDVRMLMMHRTLCAVEHVVPAEAGSEVESPASESELVADRVLWLRRDSQRVDTTHVAKTTNLLRVCDVTDC